MPPVAQSEVFTVDEVAQAAGVPRDEITAALARGDVRFIGGTRYLTAANALHIHRLSLNRCRHMPAAPPAALFSNDAAGAERRHQRVPTYVSAIVHAALLFVAIWLTSGRGESLTVLTTAEPARLVFVVSPGPGGGGGGGGTRAPQPAALLQRRSARPAALSVPQTALTPVPTAPKPAEPVIPKPAPAVVTTPQEKPADILPSEVLVAPVVATSASTTEKEGIVDQSRGQTDSRGPGDRGGSGTGAGTGNGEGLGSGLGDGAGGGTGGGPYRPGSGIEPPRLLREVKADYTDEARRRNLSGDVVLEIVVQRDGAVGEMKVLRGLGAGLDERAAAAVRQWRFDPARRRGVPVDVIVEVAVEFTLR